jgi:hypothetical protein
LAIDENLLAKRWQQSHGTPHRQQQSLPHDVRDSKRELNAVVGKSVAQNDRRSKRAKAC